MCYAKPGPRCSRHAAQALEKATAVYQHSPTMKNLESVYEARKSFNQTPAGFKKLEEEISRMEPGDDKEFALMELELSKMAREDSIRALHSGPKVNTGSSQFRLARDINAECPVWSSFDREVSEELKDYGLIVQYDTRRDAARVAHYDSRTYLANVYQVNPHEVPDDMVADLESINPREHIEARFDAELDEVYAHYSDEFHKKVVSMYYNQPYAHDDAGALEFLRSEGFTTQGQEPLEATQKFLTTQRQFPEDIEKKISEGVYVDRIWNVDFADLRIDRERYEESSADSPSLTGVIMREGQEYILLYGEDYVKQCAREGIGSSDFIIIESQD